MGFDDPDFRNSPLIRLKTLDRLICNGCLHPAALDVCRGGGMKFLPTPLEGAYVIELEKRGDHRGFFARFFCEREFADPVSNTPFVHVTIR